MKYLYFTRLKELDEVSQFRFRLALLVAIYTTLLAPVIVKLQGLYLLVQVITLYMIIENLSFKFLEPIIEKFIIGQLWHFLIIAHLIEGISLLLFFFNQKMFIYVFLIVNLFVKIIAKSYGIKQTNLFSKMFPGKVKKLQVFQINIWSEGFLIGLIISGLIQFLSIEYVLLVAFIFHSWISFYMIKNWNFYDLYFSKEMK